MELLIFLAFVNQAFAAVISIELQGSIADVEPELNNDLFGVGDNVALTFSVDSDVPPSMLTTFFGVYDNAILNWDFNFGDYNINANGPTGVFVLRNATPSSPVEGIGAAVDNIHATSNDGEVNGYSFFRSTFALTYSNDDIFGSVSLGELLNEQALNQSLVAFPTSGLQLVFESQTEFGRKSYQANAYINSYSIGVVPVPPAVFLFISAISWLSFAKKVRSASHRT